MPVIIVKTCTKCELPEGATPFSPRRKGSICQPCRAEKDRLRRQQGKRAAQRSLPSRDFSDPIGWWVTGLTDGEGCFVAASYVGPHRNKDRNGQTTLSTTAGFHAYFTLSLRDDDAETIQKLVDYFGCGRINRKLPSPGQATNARPQKKFTVNRLEELVGVVIPHFDRFPLQSRKARDFDVWKELILFVYEHLYGKKRWVANYPTDLSRLQAMCTKLRSVRQYPEAGVALQ